MTIQLNPTADSYIVSSPPPAQSQNFGSQATLICKGTAETRTLIYFDLSTLGTSVSQALLELNVESLSAPCSINIYNLTESWVENGVTWQKRDFLINLNWQTVGGTNDGIKRLPSDFNINSTGKIQLDITAYVNLILSGTSNNGILIRNLTTGIQAVFTSREGAIVDNRPKLIIPSPPYTPSNDFNGAFNNGFNRNMI